MECERTYEETSGRLEISKLNSRVIERDERVRANTRIAIKFNKTISPWKRLV